MLKRIVDMNKTLSFFKCATFFFFGIVLGFLIAPIKKGISVGNNSGNNSCNDSPVACDGNEKE